MESGGAGQFPIGNHGSFHPPVGKAIARDSGEKLRPGGFAMLNNEGEAAVMSIVSQCFQKGTRPPASGIFEASEILPTDLQTSPAP